MGEMLESMEQRFNQVEERERLVSECESRLKES